MLERLQSIDRRVIYLCLVVVIIITLFNPIGLKVSVGANTRGIFKAIDALPAGSVLWLAMDFDASTNAEQYPMVSVLLDHAFKKNLKVVSFSMWTQGGQIFRQLVEPVAARYKKVEGTDYLNIGYKPGLGVVLQAMVADISKAAAGTDQKGRPLASMPLGQQVKRLTKDYVAFIVDIAAGDPGIIDYINYVSQPEKIPMSAAVPNVSVPEQMTYVQSGNLQGLMGGLRGAAEYEQLDQYTGQGAAGMDSQSNGALLIVLFVVLGNVGYLVGRKKH